MMFVLEHAGYRALRAPDGATALATATSELPDIVLLDRHLPRLPGIEVCRHLKANPVTADIPVVFVSAGDDDGEIEACLEAGADDYVTKPFRPHELLTRLQLVIGRLRHRRAMKANAAALLTSLATHAAFRAHPAGKGLGAAAG
jgi:DNA-binding response OmpR family regulator